VPFFEELSDRACSPANVFLHQLTADDPNEHGVSSVGHSLVRRASCPFLEFRIIARLLGHRHRRLTKAFGREPRHFNGFSQPLPSATDASARGIGLAFDRHHRYRRVDLWRKRQHDLVPVAVDTMTCHEQRNLRVARCGLQGRRAARPRGTEAPRHRGTEAPRHDNVTEVVVLLASVARRPRDPEMWRCESGI
jgi:hypothetical protein